MKSKLFFGSLLAFAAASCANATEPSNYTITVNLTADEDGMYVYLTNYDTGIKLDSAIVENGVAKFASNVKDPFYARLLIEGNRIGDIFVEPAQITVTPAERDIDSNGAINAEFQSMQQKLMALANEFRALPDDSTNEAKREAIYNRYNEVIDSTMHANINNPLGYVLFTSQASGYELEELDNMLEKYPHFKDSERIKSARRHLVVKEETSVGHKYKDFAIINGDKTQRLSDYIGGDHYTLVDFWASWCGPCIRETQVIKKLYEKYNGKGLEFLGVAVWDEPENTLKAIEQHNLPWNQILNAQSIPTDLYGISGIPCIILIAPDGTIVSRDKQDEALINDVDAAMSTLQNNQE